MDYKVVLGFPYDGAFLWLLSAEQHYNKSIKDKYDGIHPYYLTLFGKNHNLLIDKTVSLTLLYEEIYLAPVDCYLPERGKYGIDSGYANQDWGIFSNYKWVRDVDQWGDNLDLLENDQIILNILNKIPQKARRHIIHDAINQIHIANQFDTAILAIPSYLELCKRINHLTSTSSLKTISSTIPTQAIEKVFNVSSLQFSINSLEDFITLKQSVDIKQYSNSFRQYISELPNGQLDEKLLFKSMVEAMNKDRISDKISGGFGLLSTLTSIFSWIPYSTPIGLTADGISRLTKSYSDKNKWWLLAPEISKVLTKRRIEEIYKNCR